MSDAIDQLRRAEVRALRAQDRQPLLRKIHWVLLKRPVNQTREQRARLRELVHSTPPRSGPWYLHELFDPFGHYRSLVWAEGWLDEWGSRIMRLADRTDEEGRGCSALTGRYSLNWFRTRGEISAAVVEDFEPEANPRFC